MLEKTLDEGYYALILAALYDLSPTTANYIIEHADNLTVCKKYAVNKTDVFFRNLEKYNCRLDSAIMKTLGISSSKIKEVTKMSEYNSRLQKQKVEESYKEFLGLMKLNLLSYEDNPELESFMTAYAPFSEQVKCSEIEKALTLFYQGIIKSEKEFSKKTHMSVKKAEEFLGII
jgi:hypothetical protein